MPTMNSRALLTGLILSMFSYACSSTPPPPAPVVRVKTPKRREPPKVVERKVVRSFRQPTRPQNLAQTPYQSAVRGYSTLAGEQVFLTIEGLARSTHHKQRQAYVYVRDSNGTFISELAKANNGQLPNDVWLKVHEQQGDQPCPVTQIKIQEVLAESARPRAVSFVTDYSGSMSGVISTLEADIPPAINELRFDGAMRDRWGLIKFDNRVESTLTLDQDSAIDTSYLQGLRGFGGSTALRDALVTGIYNLSSQDPSRERILVAFTDGYENSSFTNSWDDVIRQATQNQVKIFVVGYGSVEERVLRYLAHETGGTFYHLQNRNEIRGVIRGIIHKTKAYYLLSYTPCEGADDRTLFVHAKIPNAAENAVTAHYMYSPAPQSFGQDLKPRILALFDFNESQLSRANFDPNRLKMIAEKLKSDRTEKLILTGYTDSKGEEKYNNRLALNRAQALANRLYKLGAPRGSITTMSAGYGNFIHEPDYPSEWMAYENRRVTFKFE